MYITTFGADCSIETPRKAEKVGVRPQPLAMMFLHFCCRKHCKDGRHKKESSSYSTVNITVLRHLPKKIVLPAFQKLRCSRLAFQPESSCIYPDVSQHKPSIVQRIIQTFLRYALVSGRYQGLARASQNIDRPASYFLRILLRVCTSFLSVVECGGRRQQLFPFPKEKGAFLPPPPSLLEKRRRALNFGKGGKGGERGKGGKKRIILFVGGRGGGSIGGGGGVGGRGIEKRRKPERDSSIPKQVHFPHFHKVDSSHLANLESLSQTSVSAYFRLPPN